MEIVEAVDWSELPIDLLDLILTRLEHVPDHCRFSGVCLSWRSAAVDNRCRNVPLNQFPGLLMRHPVEINCGCPREIKYPIDNPDGTETYVYGLTCRCRKNIRYFTQLNCKTGFFEGGESALSSNTVDDEHGQQQQQLAVQVPHGQSNSCAGSAYGWLFLTDEDLSVKLLNPFSGAEIQLPSAATLPLPLRDKEGSTDPFIKWDVKKAVFSSNPSFNHPLPMIVVLYVGDDTIMLAFSREGEEEWMPLLPPTDTYTDYTDVIYYNDQFYALSTVTGEPCIVAYRISPIDFSVEITMVASWPSPPKALEWINDYCHLVEFHKELAVVVKVDGKDADIAQHAQIDVDEASLTRVSKTHGDTYRTIGFQIFRVETTRHDELKWEEVKSLGDNAMFLGLNTSYCVIASDHPGCIPNSIYFTDVRAEGVSDGDPAYDYVGYNVGIYRLGSKRVEPLHNVDAPSTCWLSYFPPW